MKNIDRLIDKFIWEVVTPIVAPFVRPSNEELERYSNKEYLETERRRLNTAGDMKKDPGKIHLDFALRYETGFGKDSHKSVAGLTELSSLESHARAIHWTHMRELDPDWKMRL